MLNVCLSVKSCKSLSLRFFLEGTGLQGWLGVKQNLLLYFKLLQVDGI